MRALRRHHGGQWMLKTIPSNWFGAQGRSTQQAACSTAVLGQHARANGLSAAAALFDIQKAFDNVRWGHVVKLAKQVNFPINLLKLIYRLHSSTRFVIVEGTLAATTNPKLSVVPGCAYADQMMFIIMYEVNKRTLAAAPGLVTAVVADDFQLLA